MQHGFLGATQKGQAAGAHASSPPGQQRQRLSPPAGAQSEELLEQCLELLRGPSDERRFVGLLLVTQLLPAGDAATLGRVLEAVGPAFLDRLLLSLKSGQAPTGDAEAAAKQVAAASLGLAVLAAAARVAAQGDPALACLPDDLVQKLPLFLKVVRAGSVATAIQAAAPGNQEAADAGANAAEDALECAVAACRAGRDGRTVALQSDGFGAAVAVLRRAVLGRNATLAGLAVALLAELLAGDGRADVITGHQEAAAQAVQLLACLLGWLAGLLQQGARLPQLQPQQQQQQQAAATQLEVLSLLLHLLPPPERATHMQAALRASAAAAEAGASCGTLEGAQLANWPGAARAYLSTLLRARVGAVQRHSALQLAAALVELAGPGWLLGSGSSSTASEEGGQTAKRASEELPFARLVLEVAKIETSVLLYDAQGAAAPVPLGSAAAPAAQDWAAPAPRGRPPGSSAEGSSDEDEGGAAVGDEGIEAYSGPEVVELEEGEEGGALAPGPSQPPAADLQQLTLSLEAKGGPEAAQRAAQREAAVTLHAAQAVEATTVPAAEAMRWEGPSECAGERAARMLPACFELLEAVTEALAADSQRSEEMVEGGGPSEPPHLSEEQAAGMLWSLQEAVGVLLQYLEQCAAGGTAAARHEPLAVAAVRVVGRFGADAPHALGGELRPLLPFLLSISSRQPGALPEGMSFLLPLLRHVVSPEFGVDEASREARAAWLRALAQPQVVQDLAAYAALAAEQAAHPALLTAARLLLRLLQQPDAQPAAAEAVARALPALLAAGQALLAAAAAAVPADTHAYVGLLAALAALCAAAAAHAPGAAAAVPGGALQAMVGLTLGAMEASCRALGVGPLASSAPAAAPDETLAGEERAELEEELALLAEAALQLAERLPGFVAACGAARWATGAAAWAHGPVEPGALALQQFLKAVSSVGS